MPWGAPRKGLTVDITEFVALYKEGVNLETLATMAGVSRTTITRRIREHTAIRKRGHARPKPEVLGPEWADLGLVPDTIMAERIGCSRQNVSKVRKARGIPSFTETVHRNARANHPIRTDDV